LRGAKATKQSSYLTSVHSTLDCFASARNDAVAPRAALG
jgi:hypothetical protein